MEIKQRADLFFVTIYTFIYYFYIRFFWQSWSFTGEIINFKNRECSKTLCKMLYIAFCSSSNLQQNRFEYFGKKIIFSVSPFFSWKILYWLMYFIQIKKKLMMNTLKLSISLVWDGCIIYLSCFEYISPILFYIKRFFFFVSTSIDWILFHRIEWNDI